MNSTTLSRVRALMGLLSLVTIVFLLAFIHSWWASLIFLIVFIAIGLGEHI